MAEQQRKRPTLRGESSGDEYTPETMPDDALAEALVYERSLALKQELERLVVHDMRHRTVDGEKAADFCVNRVVKEALSRSFRAREATDEDIDEAVMEELEVTASRIAHDLNMGEDPKDAPDEDGEFLFAVDVARECLLRCATEVLAAPVLAGFPRGARREAEMARSLMASPRRRRYARLMKALRGLSE